VQHINSRTKRAIKIGIIGICSLSVYRRDATFIALFKNHQHSIYHKMLLYHLKYKVFVIKNKE
jgi:hypothetical protein